MPPRVDRTDPPETPDAWASAFGAELSALMPLWRTAQARSGRTTVGLSFQAPAACARVRDPFPGRRVALRAPSSIPRRWPCVCCATILKALYGEAAQAEGPAPSAHQIDTWFWRQTVAGRLLIALRAVAMTSENNALKTVGARFFVPAYWLP